MIYIRFSHNQVGMFVEARQEAGDWQPVGLFKYTPFPSRAYGWGANSDVMSTERQENAYLATLDEKKIQYRVVQAVAS